MPNCAERFKAAYVKANEEEFSELPEDTYDFICAMSHSKEVAEAKEKYKEEGENYNMCRAITEMIEDGKIEGRVETFITLYQEFGKTYEETKSKLADKFNLEEENAQNYMTSHWE